ncbi:hypothetical protein [Undibacterium sp. TJN19]|uniref:hypothetical protein n=1 Tax=Undibacterium sp. TJN19 TaxID=3413055 RepID=UPI003BF0F715
MNKPIPSTHPAGNKASQAEVSTDQQPHADDIKMPHERDESPEHAAPPRKEIKQAHDDLESGQVDTDMRGQRGAEAAVSGNSGSHGADKAAAKSVTKTTVAATDRQAGKTAESVAPVKNKTGH